MSSSRQALFARFVLKPTVNSMIDNLSAVERSMSGRRLSPVVMQGDR